MATQRISFLLNSLRCITQSDVNAKSEPYFWATFFKVDSNTLTQPNPVETYPPLGNNFRSLMPDGVKDGTVVSIPPALGQWFSSFEESPLFSMVGCVVLLLEEDNTPEDAMIEGKNAFGKAMDEALNAFVIGRFINRDTSPISPQELKEIETAVKGKVQSAIKNKLRIFDLLRNQDDFIGSAHIVFTGDGIVSRPSFTLPEIANGGNRYSFSGSFTIAKDIPDPCRAQATLVRNQEAVIQAIQLNISSLQDDLRNAPPPPKTVIINQILEARQQLRPAHNELDRLNALLARCRFIEQIQVKEPGSISQ